MLFNVINSNQNKPKQQQQQQNKAKKDERKPNPAANRNENFLNEFNSSASNFNVKCHWRKKSSIVLFFSNFCFKT